MRLVRLICVLFALTGALSPASSLAQTTNTEDDSEIFVRVNGSETIPEDRRYSVVIMVNGDIDVAGTISTTLVIVDGNAQISNGAAIEGSIVMFDGVLTLRDGSLVTGDILLSRSAKLVEETGAVHQGEVQHDVLQFNLEQSALFTIAYAIFITWFGTTALTILAALAFAGIGSRQLLLSGDYLTSRPLGTILVALLVWIVLSALSFGIILTFLGIPLLIPLTAVALVVWWLGYIVVGTRIGTAILRRKSGRSEIRRPYLDALIGTLLLQGVNIVAVIGMLLLASAAVDNEDVRTLAILAIVPFGLIAAVIWIAGMLGSGSLIFRAYHVWTRHPDTVHGDPNARQQLEFGAKE